MSPACRVTLPTASGSAALLLVLLAGCATLPRGEVSATPDTGPLYAAVIDAGSSGSRIYVYRWRSARDGGIPTIEAVWEKKVEPGLSELASRPEEIGAALEPLIRFAIEQIGRPPAELRRFPLYLKGTAGLRLLSEERQRAVLEAVGDFLETTPFEIGPPEVISGQQEGIFGWISVNYILGYLDDGGPFPAAGALDLGGASTQITFVPLDAPPEQLVRLRIGGSSFPLYTHSYLGLGQDEALDKVGAAACYPKGYPIPEGGVGEGDYDRCRRAVREAIKRPCPSTTVSCTLMGTYQPPVYGEFFAFSAYTFAAAFFDLGQSFALDELERKGSAYCAEEWDSIQRTRAAELGNPYLPRNCFTAAYLVTLLEEGFGFPLADSRIYVPARLQNQEVGWTLGALLWELTGAELE